MATAPLDSEAIREQERLYNFLKKYDLHQYYKKFLLKGVHRLSHLKDVSADDASLDEIGLTRIERMRLKKKVKENVAWRGRFVKMITRKDKQFNAPIPEVARISTETEGHRSATIIAKEQVKMVRKIGEGAHGAVWEGSWADTHGAVAVAVKTLYGRQEVQSLFIKEANSMTSLNHKHIIQLYGIVLSQPLMLIEELAAFGSLYGYIQKEGKSLTLQLFHTYAYQIADAMSYLESRRIIHRDLAIRNILLAHVDYVKLSDFGMARVLDENSEEYNLSNLAARIPIAWTAPEALTTAKFSSASDVWSYGVCLWEIYSIGKKPWKGLGPVEIRDIIMEGQRLGRPERCPEDIFDLIQLCWKENPQDRPTFADIYRQLQFLPPKQVRAIKSHTIQDEPNCLSFRPGDLIYIISKPNVEWLNGMKTDGSFGHFKSEFVTEILNPVDDIRAKLASGQTSVSDIVIGSPTHVDHMTHYNKDGSKWVSESADEFDLGPPPVSSSKKRPYSSSSPPVPTSPPFRVIDARSPSPSQADSNKSSASNSMVSPLLQGTIASSSTPWPDNTISNSPHPYQIPTPKLIDVDDPDYSKGAGNEDKNQSSARKDHFVYDDSADKAAMKDMDDNNQYVAITRTSILSPAQREELALKERSINIGGGERPSEFSDTYVTMQSCSVRLQKLMNESASTDDLESNDTADTSSGAVGGSVQHHPPDASSGAVAGSVRYNPYINYPIINSTDTVSSGVDKPSTSYEPPYVNHPRNSTEASGTAFSNSQALSSITELSQNTTPPSPRSNTISAGHVTNMSSSPKVLCSSALNDPYYVNKRRSATMASSSSNASHYDIPRKQSLLDSDITAIHSNLPDPIAPVSTPSPTKKSRRFSASQLTTTSASHQQQNGSSLSDVIPPKASNTAGRTSENASGIYSISGSDHTDVTFSSVESMSSSYRPIPKPRILREYGTEFTGTGALSQAVSDRAVLNELSKRLIPPRKTSTNEDEGDYERLREDTKLNPVEYTKVQKSGNSEGGRNEQVNTYLHDKDSPRDKERKLQEILADSDFDGCEIEICKFALEQQHYNVSKAKEEIRVQLLLGMLLPNIREADCRRALSHCQQKMDRAAAWLIQQSMEIEDKSL